MQTLRKVFVKVTMIQKAKWTLNPVTPMPDPLVAFGFLFLLPSALIFGRFWDLTHDVLVKGRLGLEVCGLSQNCKVQIERLWMRMARGSCMCPIALWTRTILLQVLIATTRSTWRRSRYFLLFSRKKIHRVAESFLLLGQSPESETATWFPATL